MITEDYVSFETAKLLKENGFDDEYTNAFYDKRGILYFIDILSDFSEHPDNDTDIAASTLYVAMKWLREVKEIVIEVSINFNIDDDYKWYYEYGFCIFQLSNTFKKIAECDYDGYKTYEEACEAAIKYCLKNLI